MLRHILVAISLLFASATSALAQDLLTPSEFRDAGAARIRELAPEARVINRDELGVTVFRPDRADADGMQLNFDNAYTLYRGDPSQLEFLLDRWSRLAVDPPMERGLDRIVSILRPQSHVDGYSQVVANGPTPGRLVTRPFVGDLHEMMVFDSAEAVAYVTEEQLRELDISLEEAWTLALINIPTRMGQLDEMRIEELPGLVGVSGGNGLAPSNLVGPGFCAGPQARNLVLVTDREGYFMGEPQGAENFYGFAEWLIGRGESISMTIMECRDGRLAAVDRPNAQARTK